MWKRGRVVEGACLECKCVGNRTGGSNPSASAVNIVNKEKEDANCLASVGMRKSERCANLPGGQDEHRETGSRDFLVRENTRD